MRRRGLNRTLRAMRNRAQDRLLGPQMLAFVPAMALSAYWLGGEAALIVVTLGLPLAYSLGGAFARPGRWKGPDRDGLTGLPHPDQVIDMLNAALNPRLATHRPTLCIVLRLDDIETLGHRLGRDGLASAQVATAARLRGALRDDDLVSRMAQGVFAIAVAPKAQLDLEAAIQLSSRLQREVEAPLSMDGAALSLTCSLGFCLGTRSPQPKGSAILAAATAAAEEASANGPSAIRAHAPNLAALAAATPPRDEDMAAAFDTGQIVPYFQPQVSTDTGQVMGFEALARWIHPARGVISPADFLPALNAQGLAGRLTDLMLVQSLIALRRWDDAGLKVAQIGVNVSGADLANPHIVDKIAWQLDRYGIAPDRLAIEVLETVVSLSADDGVTRNITALAKLGCRIDLDDFGTGHASIAAIRQYAVQRLKIDRSFVTRVDRDKEQQDMVAAILTMAERLGIDTLAEGVETPGEHAMLAQLGCSHVQGFTIARPMPFEESVAWFRDYQASLKETPPIGRRAG
ncbi:GGDEF domain-containing phosphodiesterase [Pseudooceanicola aestuarii]|uniref:GGDEF domain-containing phosphodiesterase n=1 Tax=Pseudooceanicola aestuarii TaxID=2697319 RepID=UPI001EF8FF68|nr:GGDEF domain-containing phosphodiesterase [Pseudooceanicola aestuarii]